MSVPSQPLTSSLSPPRAGDRPDGGRPLTGRMVLAIFVAGFGIIIAVNVLLAVKAVSTFPGLEVDNSYVASQSFDARRRAQEALGWTLQATAAGGALRLDLRDAAGNRLDLPVTAVIGRPTEARDDTPLAGRTGAPLPLPVQPGRWRLDLHIAAPDGTDFARDIVLRVRP